MTVCPAAGAILGIFLGLYLVHGWPVKGAFGWPVVAVCAVLAFVGLMGPALLLRLAPVCCGSCGGRAFLRTDSTLLKKQLATSLYMCGACGHVEKADFSPP